MVKITKGSYGKREGKSIVRVDAEAGPVALCPEQEERLVRLGVAEYVNATSSGDGLSAALPADSGADEKADEKMNGCADEKMNGCRKAGGAGFMRSGKNAAATDQEAKIPAFGAVYPVP